ncbi:hypothetical protein NPX13_g7707 [Xylaria arbuscula]|uniref:lytic cellulose monooxygenase (C4-dehydrogenating) n=1 Tax=Xylaria arbuscula TaxID=114810 RepID=A0A9W8N9T7_9PEZI|nr:hypothetical protein NPX13_g7707 [Xylaria arbuscula]
MSLSTGPGISIRIPGASAQLLCVSAPIATPPRTPSTWFKRVTVRGLCCPWHAARSYTPRSRSLTDSTGNVMKAPGSVGYNAIPRIEELSPRLEQRPPTKNQTDKMNSFRSSLIAALACAASVAAHGHVSNIVINGVSYQTYDPTVFPYMSDPPTVVGWTASDTDNGFVEPNSFADGDIVCHKAATAAGGYATVAAGDSISIQWNTWPDSHKGPMMDYLAPCNGDCSAVTDKEALEFFKIDEAGILDSSSAPGTWASDVLIQNNNTWLVQIPANIKAGQYVLRHETIALHSAGQENGAQNYPQCFNIEITGDGTDASL